MKHYVYLLCKQVCPQDVLNCTGPTTSSFAFDAVMTLALALNSTIASNSNFFQLCGTRKIILNRSMICKIAYELLEVDLHGNSVR